MEVGPDLAKSFHREIVCKCRHSQWLFAIAALTELATWYCQTMIANFTYTNRETCNILSAKFKKLGCHINHLAKACKRIVTLFLLSICI